MKNTKSKFVRLACLCSLFSHIVVGPTIVGAQEKKKAIINFEDELIKGEASKPELFYLLQRKEYNFKKLIRLRENFLPEMRRTSEGLQ